MNLSQLKVTVLGGFERFVVLRRGNCWKKKFKGYIGNKKVLTQEQKREVQEFFKKYTKVDTTLHEFYTQKTGKFLKNYIPDDLHYCKIEPFFNDWKSARYLDNKCYYDKWYFNGINMPKTIVKRINGFWSVIAENDTEFISEDQVYALIAKQDCFVKPALDSKGGMGVQKIKKGTSFEEIKKTLSSIRTDIIVQEAITQSDTMSKLNANSVNTIRALSFLDKSGNVKVYSTIVRMGINGSFVDNASSGGITCGVESNGRLKPVAYATNGAKYDCHPTTGLEFSSVIIPNYDKIISCAQKLHKEFSHFRLISWDFAIDKNEEPLLIEVNLSYGGIGTHQLNNGPLFGEDTQKILNEVFGKD